MSPLDRRLGVVLFSLTVGVAAFLIFMLEPMVAKLVLVPYGGSAAVWNVCVMFFQIALLLGYTYSYGSWTRLKTRQPLVHIPLLALAVLTLPIALPDWAAPHGNTSPSIWLLLVLTVMVGASFVALATTSPLIQAWFSATTHSRAKDPYFLYAAGNIGSFLGLIAYPLLVEPLVSLKQQRFIWSIGYCIALLLIALCALYLRRFKNPAALVVENEADETSLPCEPITNRRRLKWLVWAAVPSSLMLGVTTYISTDIGSIPLLWVIPLSVYLLTFIVAFSRPTSARELLLGPKAFGIITVMLVTFVVFGKNQAFFGLCHIALFALVAYVCHCRLASDRPDAKHLTQFFLFVSLGGALGGAFNALVAPLIFHNAVEYLSVLTVAVLLLSAKNRIRSRFNVRTFLIALATTAFFAVVVLLPWSVTGMFAMFAVSAIVIASVLVWPKVTAVSLAFVMAMLVGIQLSLDTSRSFYGIYNVAKDEKEGTISLFHGSTFHGNQHLSPKLRTEPTSYYSKAGPLGDIMKIAHTNGPLENWALVGLGTGTSLTYSEPGEQVTAYEIDELDVSIASDPESFTYVRDAKEKADVRIVVGDGRLKIAQEPNQKFDMIILDAFSSDSIPTHLLTKEAVSLYSQKLRPGGLLAFHISNRNINLEPVIAGVAESLKLSALVRDDANPAEGAISVSHSKWAVMTTDQAKLDQLADTKNWQQLQARKVLWTDDFSNVVSLIKWAGR